MAANPAPISTDAGTGGARDARAELLRQSGVTAALGSPFVSAILRAAHDHLPRAPRLCRLIADWPLDPAASAMAMRLNAGLHALARRRTIPVLTGLYAGMHGNFDAAIAAAFDTGEDTILSWMEHPTQTNEVGRSAAFMAALMTLSRNHAMPFELLEIGASAGLNLLLDHYAHDLGGVAAGKGDSIVRIAPTWRGPAPQPVGVTIADARGVDLRPLPLHDPVMQERLMSYVWADDAQRLARLGNAIALAQLFPPCVEQGSAAAWLERQLKQAQAAGTCRVVLHSMVLQYIPLAERRAAITAILAAGARATKNRPFAWLGLEWNAPRTEVRLQLTHWRGDGSATNRVLATCHAYGAWIDWRG